MGRGPSAPQRGAWTVGSSQGGGHHQRQDEADAALAILRAEIPDYDRRVAGGEVARVMPTRKQGGTGANQFTKEGESKGHNITSAKSNRGTSKTYLISRLKRDAADPACPGRTQARHWLKRLEADLARRQTDPASPEFVKRGGDRKSEGIKVSNTDFDRKSSPKERNSKPGTLRRLARSRPDLLARVESGELSAHAAAVQAGIRKPMRSIPVDTPEAAIRALLRAWP